MTMYNYTNYYILQDYVTHLFPSQKYLLVIVVQIVTIVVLLWLFYYEIILQIFAYYFLGPSLTPNDQQVIAQEKTLLNSYTNINTQYKLVCDTNNDLAIQTLSTNVIVPALTLSGQVIPNCSTFINSL